jgi:hypothetical protein
MGGTTRKSQARSRCGIFAPALAGAGRTPNDAIVTVTVE